MKNTYKTLFITIIVWVFVLMMSCNRPQSYMYWNGIYQPPETNDYEKELNEKE